jgi:hypothetical protein
LSKNFGGFKFLESFTTVIVWFVEGYSLSKPLQQISSEV